ncbi:MAG TPA: phosphotransferase [Casimicrobiaceae bacterium]|nr:phosphotransferase [Casimicrobiaceae bacterium]
MASVTPAPVALSDARAQGLSDWLSSLGVPLADVAPASADASFRRYFRVMLASSWSDAPGMSTLIAMDAPPPNEDCRPYVHIARLLRNGGINVPVVVAADIARGYLLLGDLGSVTYASILDGDDASRLYADALDALVSMQRIRCDDELPPYDERLLRRELALFPDWYVARHLGYEATDVERAALDRAFDAIVANNLAQPCVLVHRDYHSRNLMVTTPNPGVLDFQDAVFGPITYDLVSLLRDAYVDWSEERQIDWAVRYWERARGAGLPVRVDFGEFWRDFEWMGVQRQLKVLGIFARLWHRDGKRAYLADMPRVMRYLRGACARYRELEPLCMLLDALEDSPPRVPHPG